MKGDVEKLVRHRFGSFTEHFAQRFPVFGSMCSTSKQAAQTSCPRPGGARRGMRSTLNILQLVLIHPEIVAQFMDDRQTDLFADSSLTGADRFNILLIKHDVIGTRR
jgi:hypothetical protein